MQLFDRSSVCSCRFSEGRAHALGFAGDPACSHHAFALACLRKHEQVLDCLVDAVLVVPRLLLDASLVQLQMRLSVLLGFAVEGRKVSSDAC